MGKAIIISDANFSLANLGKVTLVGNRLLRALSIDAPSAFTGESLNIRVIYNPLNTTERGVTWSIVSGAQYATIIAVSGTLTVLEGATANNVTVRATSVIDSSIFAEKTIQVTYQSRTIGELEYVGVSNNGSSMIWMPTPITPSNTYNYFITFSLGSLQDVELLGSRSGLSNSLRLFLENLGLKCINKGSEAADFRPSLDTVYKAVIGGKLYIDVLQNGEWTRIYSSSANFTRYTGDYPIYLFALNNSGSVVTGGTGKVAIREFLVQTTSGQTVVDYKPDVNVDGVPCMKDEVSGNIADFNCTAESTVIYKEIDSTEKTKTIYPDA